MFNTSVVLGTACTLKYEEIIIFIIITIIIIIVSLAYNGEYILISGYKFHSIYFYCSLVHIFIGRAG